jgi:transcription-repair coupling factor (superfamily II helicase)
MTLPESALMRVNRLYPRSLYKPAVSTLAIPRPKGVSRPDGSFTPAAFGGEPLRDVALLAWCGEVFDAILSPIARPIAR